MSDPGDVTFSLRVMINKENDKVVFAEVDSDFADVLLSFLTLPLGTIVRQMRKHFGDEAPAVGSLNTLYQGLENLDSSHFCSDLSKHVLLNASSSFAAQCRKLKINMDTTDPERYLVCKRRFFGHYCSDPEIVHISHLSCRCKKKKSFGNIVEESHNLDEGGAFTKKTATFLITDDLQVVPHSASSCLQIFKTLGIAGPDELEERTVTAGLKEIMNLLRASLLSTTPLTGFILHNHKRVSSTVTPQLPSSLPHIEDDARFDKIVIKAIISKSTDKILLAQADEDFVDFLFSLLAFPLGRVACLLGSQTSLGSVDSLYRSIKDLDGERYLLSSRFKRVLIKPPLPPEYLGENQILSFTEDLHPKLFFDSELRFGGQNGEFSHVKGPKTFMITDDLIVTPCSSQLLIKSLKRPLSDIEEVPLMIGRKEALGILKASLTSTSALTDSLGHMLRRQVKQESDIT